MNQEIIDYEESDYDIIEIVLDKKLTNDDIKKQVEKYLTIIIYNCLHNNIKNKYSAYTIFNIYEYILNNNIIIDDNIYHILNKTITFDLDKFNYKLITLLLLLNNTQVIYNNLK